MRRTSLFLLVAASALCLTAATATALTNDPLSDREWGLGKIGTPEAGVRTTGEGIRIGIVDTGVDLGHEDLAGQVVESADCTGSAGNPSACEGTAWDDHGHGTYVSGTAAAAANNASPRNRPSTGCSRRPTTPSPAAAESPTCRGRIDVARAVGPVNDPRLGSLVAADLARGFEHQQIAGVAVEGHAQGGQRRQAYL